MSENFTIMSKNVRMFFEYKRMQEIAEKERLLDCANLCEYVLNDITDSLTNAEELEIARIKQL